jgi:hypothetical protein
MKRSVLDKRTNFVKRQQDQRDAVKAATANLPPTGAFLFVTDVVGNVVASGTNLWYRGPFFSCLFLVFFLSFSGLFWFFLVSSGLFWSFLVLSFLLFLFFSFLEFVVFKHVSLKNKMCDLKRIAANSMWLIDPAHWMKVFLILGVMPLSGVRPFVCLCDLTFHASTRWPIIFLVSLFACRFVVALAKQLDMTGSSIMPSSVVCASPRLVSFSRACVM